MRSSQCCCNNKEVGVHRENEAGVDTIQALLQCSGVVQAAFVARVCSLYAIENR